MRPGCHTTCDLLSAGKLEVVLPVSPIANRKKTEVGGHGRDLGEAFLLIVELCILFTSSVRTITGCYGY